MWSAARPSPPMLEHPQARGQRRAVPEQRARLDGREPRDGHAVGRDRVDVGRRLEGRTADDQPPPAPEGAQGLCHQREGVVERQADEHRVVPALADGFDVTRPVAHHGVERGHAPAGGARGAGGEHHHLAGGHRRSALALDPGHLELPHAHGPLCLGERRQARRGDDPRAHPRGHLPEACGGRAGADAARARPPPRAPRRSAGAARRRSGAPGAPGRRARARAPATARRDQGRDARGAPRAPRRPRGRGRRAPLARRPDRIIPPPRARRRGDRRRAARPRHR